MGVRLVEGGGGRVSEFLCEGGVEGGEFMEGGFEMGWGMRGKGGW